MKRTINKLLCVICAVGTYIMAFMAADIINRGVPFDFISGAAIIICNAAMLYLFIVCGFGLMEQEQPNMHRGKCSVKPDNTDYFDRYFNERE